MSFARSAGRIPLGIRAAKRPPQGRQSGKRMVKYLFIRAREGAAEVAEKKGTKRLAENRKARHEYFIEDTYECGIALAGTEVKSIRAGKVNLKDSYAQIKKGEAYIIGMHISPYEQGNIFNRDPFRERKLLLHKSEIRKLLTASQVEGYSLIPLQLYLKDGLVKLELAVAKGKKLYDKRSDIAGRDAKREMERRLKDVRFR